MKIRNGFVSNSSSSSFVIVGIPFDDSKYDEAEREKLYDDYMILYPGEDDVPEPIIGIEIAGGDDTNFGGESYSLAELNREAQELVDKFGGKIEDVQIYSGVRMC